jgi:PAS domain S-box-containing protein
MRDEKTKKQLLIEIDELNHRITVLEKSKGEFKQMQALLLTKEKELSSIYNNISEVLYLLSVEEENIFRFLTVNQAFLNATGLKENQVVNNYVHNVIPEPSLTSVLSNYKKAIREKKTVRWQEVSEYPTGIKYGDVTITPILDASGQCTNLIGSVHDLTESKKAEDELRHSNEWLGFVQHAAKSGFWDWDIVTEKIKWSPEFYDLFGLPPTAEASFDTWLEMLHSDDREPARNKINRAIEEHKFLENDYRVIRPDGEEIWIRALGSTLYDDAGMPQRMSGICLDITKSKTDEQAYRDVEDRYHALFDNMLNGLAYCKMIFEEGRPKDFIYIDVNQAFDSLTGLKDVVGKKVSEVIPNIQESDQKLFEIFGRVALTGQPETFEIYLESLKMWFSISVYSPRKEYFVAVFDVITERKNAEIALQKSEERFRAVAESAVDAIVTTDVTGQIRFFNNSLKTIFGYSKEELTGKLLTILMPERFKSNYLNELERFKESGQHRLIGKTVVTTGLKKDGTEFPFEMSLSSWKSGEKIYFTSIIRDLTEKKKVEKELKESEKRLKMGMDIANLVYWEYDVDSDMFYFDDQFYALYATTSQQEGANKMSSQEYATRFIPPEESSVVTEKISKALETDDPDYSGTIQHTIIRADGEKRVIVVRFVIIKDENGRTIKTMGVNQDITEQKTIEKALKESEAYYRTIFDNSGAATVIIENDTTISLANPEFEKLSGYSVDELEGKKKWTEFVLEDDSERMKGYHRQRRIDQELAPENYEFRFINRQGDVRNIILYVALIPGTEKSVASLLDITDLKNMQKKLEKSVLRFRALAEYALDGIITTDSHGKILYFNNSLLKMFGYTQDELQNSPLTILMPGRFRENFMMGLRKFRSTGEHRLVGRTIETTGLKKDGDEFSFEMSLTKWKSDEKIYFTSIIRDITERKKAEDDLRESLKEKEVLLREIHHRVKNNMEIISSLLNMQIRHVEEEEAENVLLESQGRVKSMAMIHEKLYQSKSLSKINFKEYVENLVSDIFYSYGIKKGTIEPDLEIEDINIDIDTAIPLGLIINELVTNSVKYAFPKCKGSIKIKLKSSQDQLELTLADNGVGLPDDLDYKYTDSLGLQLINGLVGQIDGEIELDKSHGTQFKITFKE